MTQYSERNPVQTVQILFKAAVWAASLYALLCAAAFFFSDKIAFRPPKPSYSLKDSPAYRMLDAGNGLKICAAWLENPGAEYTILYSHGNGEDLGEIMHRLKALRSLGFSVMSFDYPGYGESGGSPKSSLVYPCADAAWRELTENLGIPPEKIAVFGYSMGSSAACYLAAEKNPRAAVIHSGFSTAVHALLPVNILPWDILNNEKMLQRASCPVLIIHGTRDFVVPFRNGRRLFSKANAPKFFVPVEGAGHYSIPDEAPWLFLEGIPEFIKTGSLDASKYGAGR